MNGIHQALPLARKSELVTREVAGELLIYDRTSDEAHCLNPTAALVWANCDGQTTIAELARLLEAELKAPVADEIVWFALAQLEKWFAAGGSPAYARAWPDCQRWNRSRGEPW